MGIQPIFDHQDADVGTCMDSEIAGDCFQQSTASTIVRPNGEFTQNGLGVVGFKETMINPTPQPVPMRPAKSSSTMPAMDRRLHPKGA
jgi:hypothetical protein